MSSSSLSSLLPSSMTVAMGGLARLRGPMELPGADLRDRELISAQHFYRVVVAVVALANSGQL